MPRRKPTPPPVTATDCTRELCQMLDRFYVCLDEGASLDLAKALYIVVQNAVQSEYDETVALLEAGVDFGDDPLRYSEVDLQQLAVIEDVLSYIEPENALEGR